MTRIEKPNGLRPEAARFYETIVKDYDLSEHHFELLHLACEALSRSLDAGDVLRKEGLTYTDRFGAPRLRPEVRIKEAAELNFARFMKQLNFDTDEPRPPGRPPGR